MMEPRIKQLMPKQLTGIRKAMSFGDNKTVELWREFMLRRHEIKNRVNTDYISMQIYEDGDKLNFSPSTTFEKWASVEVFNDKLVPDNMEPYTLNGGLYAVFEHIGPASAAQVIMQHIFGVWLPSSKYKLDNREHFEVLPEGYNPADPEAREEIWVPIK